MSAEVKQQESNSMAWLLGIMILIGVLVAFALPASSRSHNHAASRRKSHLKSIGQAVAIYFVDVVTPNATYPKNVHLFEFDEKIFQLSRIPDNWQELNESNSPFLFVRSVNDVYEGDATKVMFVEKEGHSVFKGKRDLYFAVFEDGHVEGLSGAECEKYWSRIKDNQSAVDAQ